MSRKDFALKMREEFPPSYPENYGHSYVHPSSYVYEDYVTIGQRCIVHAGVVIGGPGFGFERIGDALLHISHIGKVVIEDNVEIFDGTIITRGTIGDTVIGEGTKIDAICHVAHNVKIGKHCLIASMSGIGGSVEIGDWIFMGTGTIVRDHLKIASRTFLGSGSNVLHDITGEGQVWAGNPARFIRMRKEGE